MCRHVVQVAWHMTCIYLQAVDIDCTTCWIKMDYFSPSCDQHETLQNRVYPVICLRSSLLWWTLNYDRPWCVLGKKSMCKNRCGLINQCPKWTQKRAPGETCQEPLAPVTLLPADGGPLDEFPSPFISLGIAVRHVQVLSIQTQRPHCVVYFKLAVGVCCQSSLIILIYFDHMFPCCQVVWHVLSIKWPQVVEKDALGDR